MYNIDPNYCQWDITSTLLIFSDNVFGNFIYYSHLLPIACLIVISLFLIWNNYKNFAARALLLMTLFFSLWSLTDLVLWATANPSHTMFFWSIIIHFEVLFYFSALYFAYYFISEKEPGFWLQLTLLIGYLPFIIFSHTTLNLQGFDYTNCYREAWEGPLVTYAYVLEIIIVLWILVFGIKHSLSKTAVKNQREIILATGGVTLALLSFSLGNILGTFEIDWELGQYGLFGLPAFVALLTFLIVQYKSFNTKLFATQALVLAILIMVVSILFVRNVENIQIITGITSLLILVLGYLLIKSVKKEIQQREKVEELAKKLESANVRLKQLDQMKSEFVSIASHQLRSPLTSIRGYASMLLEGSYGKLPPKATETIQKIADSSRFMALSVEDYLNVSRIESGNMKYNYSDFNLKELAEKVADELRPEALKKGLLLTFKSDVTSQAIVNADVGKIKQVIQNLVDNSMKYTPKGTVNIFVHDNKKLKKIYVDISDTGIGMSEHTIDSIFDKFERAHNANEVNVTGTGLGLYVAKKMAEAMKGSVVAKSEGEGKGSTFSIELPLAM